MGFVAPGLVHAFGNQLFALRSAGLLLGGGHAPPGLGDTMRQALDQADGVLEILRLLSERSCPPLTLPGGDLLGRIAHLCRVPLRDRQLSLELDPDAATCDHEVPTHALLRLCLACLHSVMEEFGGSAKGKLRLSLELRDNAVIALLFDLPDPVDPAAVAARLDPALQNYGSDASVQDERRLRLVLPGAC